MIAPYKPPVEEPAEENKLPVCKECGGELVRMFASCRNNGERIYCLANPSHKQPAPSTFGTFHLNRMPHGVACKTPTLKHNQAEFNAWDKRNAAAWEVTETTEERDGKMVAVRYARFVPSRVVFDAKRAKKQAKLAWNRLYEQLRYEELRKKPAPRPVLDHIHNANDVMEFLLAGALSEQDARALLSLFS